MGSDALSGAAGGSRDGGEPSRATAVVESLDKDRSFLSKGQELAPVLGSRGTHVTVYYGGAETLQIKFGDFQHTTEVWTTLAGLDTLISELLAAKRRIESGRGA